MNNILGVLVAMALLALNFAFVAAEFALISTRRTKIEPLAQSGSRAARTTLRALEDVSDMLATTQLGITVCTVGLGAVGEPAVAHLLEPVFAAVTVPDALVYPISFVIALTAVVTVHVVVGEMVPKNIALALPEQAALMLAPPLMIMAMVLKPLIWVINRAANAILRVLKVTPQDEIASTFTHEEVSGLVDEAHREGTLESDSYELVSGALAFTGRTVETVLLPIAGLRSVREDDTLADVERLCAETGFSRFPVLRATPADRPPEVLGYLHIKDVLETDHARQHRQIEPKRVRPMATLGGQTRLWDAMRSMQSRGAHLARVVDDQGTDLGVITLEDVLEELVGEVRDLAAQDITR